MDEKLRKKTDDLMKELSNANIDFESYIAENKDSLIEINLREFWSRALASSDMSNSDIINKSELSYYYFYEVINGKKVPTTDKIVALALATKMTLEDCQTALKYCGRAPLYPRIHRDSILIYAITHRFSLIEANELLEKSNESRLK